MAAFALGLIGESAARDPLVAALADESPLVRGSAAEALGLVGDAAAAEPIGRMAAAILESGALAGPLAESAESDRGTPAGAFRLALNALARLKAVSQLSSVVLDAGGQPRFNWWPVAAALAFVEDPRALPSLRAFATDAHPYTRAFAVRGLGALADRQAVPLLLPMARAGDRAAALEAVRALARIGDPAAAKTLADLVRAPETALNVRIESVAALGAVGGEGTVELLTDLLSDRSPSVRAAALRGLARIDPEGFVFILSGLDPDAHWSVRASLAEVLGTLKPEAGLPRLATLLEDADARVIPSVLAALTALRAPDAPRVMLESLKAEDPEVRAAAARALGELRPAQGAAALAESYRQGQRDVTPAARAAALVSLARYGQSAAVPVLNEALEDKDWAVRVRAAVLLRELDPASNAGDRIRPAPSPHQEDFYATRHLIDPAVSTQAYIETDKGTIQVELAVLDAPLTVENFASLAIQGFFDGVPVHRIVPGSVLYTGDRRGDGAGGAGRTIRDELNQRPFLRGAVAMTLDWEESGSSQFYITLLPQPESDGRQTVFGRVVSGMDVADRLEQWDVIRRVRIWDGQVMSSN
jgi:peptidylprolyl isomerase